MTKIEKRNVEKYYILRGIRADLQEAADKWVYRAQKEADVRSRLLSLETQEMISKFEIHHVYLRPNTLAIVIVMDRRKYVFNVELKRKKR